MRLIFLRLIVIISIFCALACSENKKKMSVKTPLLNKIELDKFDNIEIESLFRMNTIIIKDNSEFHLEYGKMDYSEIRKTVSVVNDEIFLEVDSKVPIDLEDLKERMSQLNIKGPYQNSYLESDITKNIWAWRLKSKNKQPDFGCILTYYTDTGKMLLECKQMTREWFVETVYCYRVANDLPVYDYSKYEMIETFE